MFVVSLLSLLLSLSVVSGDLYFPAMYITGSSFGVQQEAAINQAKFVTDPLYYVAPGVSGYFCMWYF